MPAAGLVLALLGPALASGQSAENPAPKTLADEFARIHGEALAHPQAYSKLAELCLAAPHRLSGSAGAANAVTWAASEMEAIGLENVRLEPCTVPHWERGARATLTVVAPEDKKETFLPILALGGSAGTPREGVQGELLIVRSFEELDCEADAARGKIVLFDRPMDPRELDPFEAYGGAVNQRGRGAIEAAKRGAVAAIVRSMTLRLDDVPHTGAMRYEEGVPRIPAAAVSTAGAERLGTLARSGKKVTLSLRLDCVDRGEAPSHNVVGEIRGASRPEEIVLIGAHLDAWDVGQGAHDDGAGCVHVLEALRILKTLGLRPARTIRGVLFMNEENGLRGGIAYRDAHKDELQRHVLAIESDRGGFVPRGFATDAQGSALAALREIAALLEPAGASMMRPGEGGADISVLRRDGVVLMELVTDPQRYFDLHHSSRDTLDTVHPRELELGAAVLAAMAYGAAEAGDRLPPAGVR
ncbi:MAG: M28 family peptidase [Planctomycetota bacterium]